MSVASASSAPVPQTLSLKQRVLTAGAWSLAGYGVSIVLRFGSNLIMTRLLVPEMFGVMAIGSVIMIGLSMFSDFGLRLSIVQSGRGRDPAFLDTAWVVQIARGFLLWAIAVALGLALAVARTAGLLEPGSAYADPQLPWVLGLVAFGTVISGFESTRLAEASRNLDVRRITLLELATQVVGLAVMLTWAAFDRTIWSMIAGGLAAALLRTVLTHVWLPGHANHWRWDHAAFLEMAHFGKWIFLTSVLGFLAANADRLLLGGMIDSAALGVYVIAFSIFSAIDQLGSRTISSVAFPALSEVVRAKGDLRSAYYRLHAVIASIVYASAGVLMVCGSTLIALLYDQRYADAGWMLQILAVILLTMPPQLALQAYLALGRPQLHSRILILRLVALAVGVPLGFSLHGLAGALCGIAASNFAPVPLLLFYNGKFGMLDARRELLPLVLLPLGMAAGWLLVQAARLL